MQAAEGIQKPKFQHVKPFVRKNAVLLIAFGAAVVSAFLVPPDAQYAGYFDW